MPFELYNGYRKRFVDELYITIHPNRRISFNRVVYEVLGQPEAIVLQYDKKRRLGISKASRDDAYAIPVRSQGHNKNYSIAATSFTKEYEIDTAVSRQYRVVIDKEGRLIADLKKVGIDVTHSRHPRESKKAETLETGQNEQLSAFQQLSLETDPFCNDKALQESCDTFLSQVKEKSKDEQQTIVIKLLTDLRSILSNEG